MLRLRAVIKNIQFRSPRCGSIPIAYRLRTGRSAGAEMVIIPGLKPGYPIGIEKSELKSIRFFCERRF
jgi:hypothetical protein